MLLKEGQILTYRQYVQKLEDADKRVTFTRFGELPRELRVEVNKWHFAQLRASDEKRCKRSRMHDGEGPLP